MCRLGISYLKEMLCKFWHSLLCGFFWYFSPQLLALLVNSSAVFCFPWLSDTTAYCRIHLYRGDLGDVFREKLVICWTYLVFFRFSRIIPFSFIPFLLYLFFSAFKHLSFTFCPALIIGIGRRCICTLPWQQAVLFLLFGKLLKIQVLGLHSRLIKSEYLQVGSRHPYFKILSKWCKYA